MPNPLSADIRTRFEALFAKGDVTTYLRRGNITLVDTELSDLGTESFLLG